MNLSAFRSVLIIGLLATVFSACEKEYETTEEQDQRVITDYIKQSSLSMQQYNSTGIYYQVTKPGVGDALDFSQNVLVVMTVRSIGTGFVATDTITAFNRYAGLFGYLKIRGIPGSETIPRLVNDALGKKGGTIRLLIPSKLAFGRNPVTKVPGYGTDIPGNSSLDVSMTVLQDSKLPQYDDQSIQKYIAANNLTGFTKNALGTYYKIINPGTDEAISVTSTITAEYTGKLLNGVVFDQAASGAAATFLLSDLVQGWQQTLPLIKSGGSIQMIIPSRYAYGMGGSSDASGNFVIPQFSCLYFEIKVTEVVN